MEIMIRRKKKIRVRKTYTSLPLLPKFNKRSSQLRNYEQLNEEKGLLNIKDFD